MYLCSSIQQHQVFNAGLHGDVGPDQQLQSTDCWKLLKGREEKNNDKQSYTERFVGKRRFGNKISAKRKQGADHIDLRNIQKGNSVSVYNPSYLASHI